MALQNIWLEKEYENTRIQSEVKLLKTDDKVLVSNNGFRWIKRYFKKYDAVDERIIVFANGVTSWSSMGGITEKYIYAKLPEESEGK